MSSIPLIRAAQIICVGCSMGLAHSSVFASAELSPMSSHAPPLIVVEDLGGIDAAPFFAAFEGMEYAETNLTYEPTLRADVPLVPFSEANMLPVVSDSMTPAVISAGELDAINRDLHLPAHLTPFFIVGDDSLSMDWLRVRQPQLAAVGAVGLAVNVQDLWHLNEIRAVARDLEIRPVHGDDLAQNLGISHYPVFVSGRGVEQ